MNVMHEESKAVTRQFIEDVWNAGRYDLGLEHLAREDLSFASTKSAPRAGTETKISSVTFPIVQTNPQQDPVISYCYAGDYNNITSNGTTRFVTWGDNRNVVTTSAGVTENQPDVFLQSY